MRGASARDAVPVAFVSSHARLGGSERYLEWLLEALEPSWVRIVVSLEEGAVTDHARALGYPTEVIPTGARHAGLVWAAAQLRPVLLRRHPAVVHANGIKAAAVSGLATVATGLPVVWVKHDFAMDGWIASLVARRCRQIVGVSEAVTRTFGPRDRPKVHVVNAAIPEFEVSRARGRELVLDAFGRSNPEKVVILAGRMHPGKGHGELLEIAPGILERLPQTGFLVLGGTEFSSRYAVQLRRRAAELGLEDSMVFVAHRPDAAMLISGCDLLVHASVLLPGEVDTEGFPIVALESMLVGTPVVGYANGGLPELLADCGRLVARGDRSALRDAIVQLLENDALRSQLAECGRRRVQARYRMPRHVEAMKDRYRAAAGR